MGGPASSTTAEIYMQVYFIKWVHNQLGKGIPSLHFMEYSRKISSADGRCIPFKESNVDTRCRFNVCLTLHSRQIDIETTSYVYRVKVKHRL